MQRRRRRSGGRRIFVRNPDLGALHAPVVGDTLSASPLPGRDAPVRSAAYFLTADWTMGIRSGREMSCGVDADQIQEVFAVTIAASGREHRDVCDADVFSWNELPELLAAEDLFEVGSASCDPVAAAAVADAWPTLGNGSVIRGEDEDNEEFDDDEDDDDEEDEDDDDDEEEEEDEEWEEVEDEDEEEDDEDEDEDEEEEEEDDEDDDWEDDDEDWEDDDDEDDDEEDEEDEEEDKD